MTPVHLSLSLLWASSEQKLYTKSGSANNMLKQCINISKENFHGVLCWKCDFFFLSSFSHLCLFTNSIPEFRKLRLGKTKPNNNNSKNKTKQNKPKQSNKQKTSANVSQSICRIHKIQRQTIPLNSFYKASIAMLLKEDRDIRRKQNTQKNIDQYSW